MQTLISVFDKRSAARRAIERLLQAGFDSSDIHLQEPDQPPAAAPSGDASHEQELELGERVMESAEREVAVDPGVLESIAKVFAMLFGGGREAGAYSEAVRRGQSVLVVDAMGDQQAEVCAVILHEEGAVDVDDHHAHEVPESVRRGVRKVERPAQPPLRELAAERNLRAESLLADRPEGKNSG